MAAWHTLARKLSQFDFYAEGYVSSGSGQDAWARMLEVRCGPTSKPLSQCMLTKDRWLFRAPQAIPAVTERVARGIVAEYPTVRSLWQAYKAARTVEDAQLLLQDIAVCGQHVPIRRRALDFTHTCLHACGVHARWAD